MKKSMILVLIQFSLISLCSAQFINSLEIRTGVNRTKLVNEKGEGMPIQNSRLRDIFDPQIGLNLEVNAYSAFDEQLYYGIGLHYAELKFEHQLCCLITGGNFPNLDSYSYNNTVNITNIGMSLMARYDVGKKRKLAQMVGGFCFYKSFNDVSNTDVAYSGNGPIDPVLISPNFKIDSISNSINISVSAGLRALLPIGKRGHVSIGGNLEYFLMPDEYYFAPKKGNIFSIGATLGYLVNL